MKEVEVEVTDTKSEIRLFEGFINRSDPTIIARVRPCCEVTEH